MASDSEDRPVDLAGCVVIREERFKALILADERRQQILREVQELHDMLDKSLASDVACKVWTRLKAICAANKMSPGRKRAHRVEKSKPGVVAEWHPGVPVYSDAGIKFLRREDLKKALTPAAWRSLAAYCDGCTAHVSGPFLTNVDEWLAGYNAPAFRQFGM